MTATACVVWPAARLKRTQIQRWSTPHLQNGVSYKCADRQIQALHNIYCHVIIVSHNLRLNCVFLFFITACGVRGPAKARRISHICDRVLRDWDNVWHCGSKLIPARIIIRSSSDKSVMICDTQRDKGLAASQRCGGLCYLESGWVSWYSSLSETIKTLSN